MAYRDLVYADDRAPYPRFYWYGGRRGSDRARIMFCMRVIPDDRKREVAEEYERLFLSDRVKGRELANDYLSDLWAEQVIGQIPSEQREYIREEYEDILGHPDGGRKKAAEYLRDISKEYKQSRPRLVA